MTQSLWLIGSFFCNTNSTIASVLLDFLLGCFCDFWSHLTSFYERDLMANPVQSKNHDSTKVLCKSRKTPSCSCLVFSHLRDEYHPHYKVHSPSFQLKITHWRILPWWCFCIPRPCTHEWWICRVASGNVQLCL